MRGITRPCKKTTVISAKDMSFHICALGRKIVGPTCNFIVKDRDNGVTRRGLQEGCEKRDKTWQLVNLIIILVYLNIYKDC